MERTSQESGRVNQKSRTRSALVEAATRLMKAGAPPTVSEAADEAKVSRATAYRYFPTQEALLIELSIATPTVSAVEDRVKALSKEDPAERLAELLRDANSAFFAEEAAMRTALRLYLDTWLESRRRGEKPPTLREGRRMRWLDEALKPVRKQITEKEWRQLRAALALTLGAEAMVVMKDVCRLKDKEALEVLAWTGEALLKAALDKARAEKRRRAA
ncbi:MAG TPA: helix-turn-helix domain-containing protein [Burkholderiales bacterium]